MELNKVLYMYAATVALLLCSSVNFIQSPSDVFGPVALLEPTPSAARDFGAVVSEAHIAVMQPGSPADIARLLGALSSSSAGARAAVAACGAGHSLHGQAQARASWRWCGAGTGTRTRTWAAARCGWRCWRSA